MTNVCGISKEDYADIINQSAIEGTINLDFNTETENSFVKETSQGEAFYLQPHDIDSIKLENDEQDSGTDNQSSLFKAMIPELELGSQVHDTELKTAKNSNSDKESMINP